MELHQLKSVAKSRHHRSKIVGRGHGSGLGKTSGRGQKGQKARKSGLTRPGFEGGQTPLYRRLPKFVNARNGLQKQQWFVLNLKQVSKLGVDKIDRELLIKKHLLSAKSKLPLKLIGNTKLERALHFEVNKVSKNALVSVQNAAGSVKIIK